MKFTTISQTLLLAFSPLAISATTPTQVSDPASVCYNSPVPTPSPINTNRTIPWGTPSYTLPNGTTCCDSLDQVRAGINDINAQLVDLLAQRAAYVREATRFKATLGDVNVPSRNQEVIDGAVALANQTVPRLPEEIARGVFEAIINESVPFEECVWAISS
ncbi:predicted protein [Sclerotinia sclerotiorum 1980 UF-70]|uniref:Chorismate mutase domain-containing protein n=2 Tax=Sclerotinia sclerotiorum (strain ATCC 18683 / 1980 / Ss-1) TaxID=665079 RepID=A7F9N9_SCLS1|nr:predicted protein [Sclerotinia sclerotiorum 1980 UF-70]APA16338.1 hypothetical protein sscle_16g111080 [Sclerotinia sclerotiorum 1980 UF-70]EDO00450.1 predicted protein [Sclerotinia sclerotiorum 1980 UF-70]